VAALEAMQEPEAEESEDTLQFVDSHPVVETDPGGRYSRVSGA
jgi:hypothetical protein